jgi:hypothetical protein
MATRTAVIAIGLVFGIWEAVDTADTGAPAAVFAVLFLTSVALLARRGSRLAALVVGLLCVVEATQAHTWKDAGRVAKVCAEVLGSAGIAAVAAHLVHPLVRRRHA